MMVDLGLVASCYIALFLLVMASPIIELLGGDQYRGATTLLQIQGFALIGTFLAVIWQYALISIHRQRALIVSNSVALVVVLILGYVLIRLDGATGAAVATVVGETVLAIANLVMLVRADTKYRPQMRVLLKVAAAVGAALIVIIVLNLAVVSTLVLMTALYVAIVLITSAVPRETLSAFRILSR